MDYVELKVGPVGVDLYTRVDPTFPKMSFGDFAVLAKVNQDH